jgi:hypothetical protein
MKEGGEEGKDARCFCAHPVRFVKRELLQDLA